MARVEGWKADKVFVELKDVANRALRDKAIDVRDEAIRTVGVNPAVRKGRFSLATVSFTPSKGRKKNIPVTFKARRWLGRNPGDLRSTIRLVEKAGKSGNFRVYAGNFKQYWAPFAERGVKSPRKIPQSLFLRRAVRRVSPSIKNYVQNEVSKWAQ